MIQRFVFPVKDSVLDFFDTEGIKWPFTFLASSNAIIANLMRSKQVDLFLSSAELTLDAVEEELDTLTQKYFKTGYQFPYEHVLCAYAVAVYKMGDLEKLKELDDIKKHSENYWFGQITKTLYMELQNEEGRIC